MNFILGQTYLKQTIFEIQKVLGIESISIQWEFWKSIGYWYFNTISVGY